MPSDPMSESRQHQELQALASAAGRAGTFQSAIARRIKQSGYGSGSYSQNDSLFLYIRTFFPENLLQLLIAIQLHEQPAFL